jgi:cell cycle checkpoint protein
MIYSEVTEGNVNEGELGKLVAPEILHNPSIVCLVNLNKVTIAKLKKTLGLIVKKEGQSQPLSSNDMEDICQNSAGDIRSAIMSLQFHMAATSTAPFSRKSTKSSVGGSSSKQHPKKSGDNNVSSTTTNKKDTRLSSFHALGKALYAKRQEDTAIAIAPAKKQPQLQQRDYVPTWHSFKWKDTRPPLNFDPESVVMENPMGVDGALAFLQYHCVDFFEDETELSDALATFSDTMMLGSAGRTLGDGGYSRGPQQQQQKGGVSSSNYSFPHTHMASLAGRAVAEANKHPTPGKWRSLGAPKTFEVRRKMMGNQQILNQLCRRLSSSHASNPMYDDDDHDGTNTRPSSVSDSACLPLDACLGSTSTQFVTGTLPYLRRIYPHDTHDLVSTMHTAASTEERPSHHTNHFSSNQRGGSNAAAMSSTTIIDDDARMLQELLDHSKQILQEDDIVDD